MKQQKQLGELKGVGEKLRVQLKDIGIETITDLIDYFPRDYQDYSSTQLINELQPGPVTIKVRLSKVSGGYRRGGMHITNATAGDETGKVKVTWFNQPYRAKAIKPDVEYFISGELKFSYGTYQLVNPSLEAAGDMPANTARILPIYKERKGLKSRILRNIFIKNADIFSHIEDKLPQSVKEKNNLIDRQGALREVHIPTSTDALASARKRIGFDEVFELQLASLISKDEAKKFNSPELKFSAASTKEFISKLSFTLTDAQRKSAWDIVRDIDSPHQMNRLLQGDVGSGKTIVAGIAIEQCLRSGWQAVLMAPTEVLAKQHHKTISSLFPSDKVYFASSELTGAQKKELSAKAASSEPGIFVGTHALIQQSVEFSKLGLAVVDEQHRFGVEQRRHLLSNKVMPHLLSMTATPIPRSLALTVYGEMDVSIINELPPGRQKIETKAYSFQAAGGVDDAVAAEIKKGNQVYIICPLIEQSETISAKNAEEEYLRVKRVHLKANVALLHGRQKAEEKEQAIQDFKNKDIDILVSTTVVEVGVDVPGATLIVIEGAERFGLAQLHQLRGRVGRSSLKSSCILVTSPGAQVSNRLKAMEDTNDGFKLAEIDLEIRGPGAIYGTRQHGALDLRMASLADTRHISHVRKEARAFLDEEDINDYPALAHKVTKLRSLTQLN